jgi:hypothetical protein
VSDPIAPPIALVESAAPEGVESRRRALRERRAVELGWNYANIVEAAPRLAALLSARGFFRLYLYIPGAGGPVGEGGGEEGMVRHAMRVTALDVFPRAQMHTDPADGRRYLVHSKMTVAGIEDLPRPRPLSSFASADSRHMDERHLQSGFLFVEDREG